MFKIRLITIAEWREKHKKDYNHGKSGYVAGNPRYSQSNKQTYSGKAGQTREYIKSKDEKSKR